MKKILMLLAVIALMLGVSGQAMATSSYFVDGDLIRVVYSTVDQTEVVTDLGAFNATDGSAPLDLSFASNPFPGPGSSTFPNSTWADLQVAYFAKTGTQVWVSGQFGGQLNVSNKFDTFQSAAEYVYLAARAAAGSGAQAILSSSDLQSYETVMNNGDIAPGSFAQFTPDQDGEQNLGSLGVGVPSEDSYLYYYANPDVLSEGAMVAHISTNSNGTSGAVGAHFVVVMPSTTVAGAKVAGTVYAVDTNNYIDLAYAGQVYFTNTGAGVTLPATLAKPLKLKNGMATFTATFTKVGSQTLTAIGATTATTPVAIPSMNSDPVKISVTPAAAKTLSVVPASLTQTTGVPFNVTVTALDPYGNTAPSYTGTVHLSSSDKDPLISMPSDHTFTGSDKGVYTFTGAKLLTGGATQTISAGDTAPKSAIKGTSAKITLNWAPAVSLTLTIPAPGTSTVTAGTPFNVKVTALDANSYITGAFTGTLTFTSSNPVNAKLKLPAATSKLTKGIGTFAVTLATAGTQTLHVAGSGVTSPADLSFTVNPGAAASFVFAPIALQTHNVPFTITVTAKDACGNTATGYSGTPVFTSSDTTAGVVLPGTPFTWVSGVITPSVTLQKVVATPTTTITATAGTIKGTSAKIAVN